MQDSFGMMDGAYFVSRIDLLGWINDLLQLNLTKIEQLGTGAVYCQILDVCFPGKVPLNKVNWRAKYEYEFFGNFKLLQLAFNQLGIKKQIEVEKLAKAKYQDNLEFGQWMKRFYELRFGQDSKRDYNPKERRGSIIPDFPAAKKGGASTKPIAIPLSKEISKNKREERVVEKRIKLSNSSSKPVKPKAAEKGEGDMANPNSLLKEREELTQKLEFIQQLITSNKESDGHLLKKVRDFMGMMAFRQESFEIDNESLLCSQVHDSESLLPGGEEENSLFLANFPQNDLSFVIEGESL